MSRPVAVEPAVEPDEKPIDLRRHLGVIRARFWMIVLCVAVVLTFHAVQVFRQPPVYQAAAQVLIERKVASVVPFADPAAAMSEGFYNYRTAVRLITSREVMERALYQQDDRGNYVLDEKGERVLTDFGQRFAPPVQRRLPVSNEGLLRQTWARLRNLFRQQSTRSVEPWEVLRGRVNVVPDPSSNIVEIRVAGRDSQQVADIANAVARAFVSYGRKLRERGEIETFRELMRQMDDQKRKYDEAEKALNEYRNRHGLLELSLASAEDPSVAQDLQRLKAAYAEAQRLTKEMSAALALAETLTKEARPPRDFLAVPQVRERPEVRSLYGLLTQNSLELDLAGKTYGPKHTRVVELEERQKAIEVRYDEAILDAVRSLRDEYQILLKREATLKDEFEAEKTRVENVVKLSSEHRRLLSAVDFERRTYEAIREQLKSVDIRLAAESDTGNIKLIEEASRPRFPSGPNKQRAVVFGALLGLALGLAVAYLLEYLDDTVKTPDDMERQLRLAPLGYLPEMQSVADGREGFIERATHSLAFPLSSTTEAFRAVRTSVYFSGERGQMKSLVVTSPAPGDGKTSVTTNLAITIAQDRKRVLLVDADLRRPMIHHAFGIEREPGLSNLLAEGVALERIVRPMPETETGALPNLHIVPAGAQVPNPTELMGGEAMAEFMRRVREDYDVIIYDSCPILLVSDAAMIAAGADGAILVTKVGRSRRDAVRRARRQLEAVGARVIGAVLNGVGPRALRGHRYGYYYGYGAGSEYHAYYRDEKAARKPRSSVGGT